MTAPERFDWVWYGVDSDGNSHVSLGRWQKHPCQFRYKFADPQPTEHDHRADLHDATERKLAKAVEALRGLLRFAENTVSELGIILGSAYTARAVLAEIEKGGV